MNIFGTNKQNPLVGRKITLEHMEDFEPIPDGATGTIVHVDDWGHYHVQWDNGRALSVIPGEDRFKIADQ